MEEKWTYSLWGAPGLAAVIMGVSSGMPVITPESIIIFSLGMSGVGMLCVAAFDKAKGLSGIAEDDIGRGGAGSETAVIRSPEQGSSRPAPTELKEAA